MWCTQLFYATRITWLVESLFPVDRALWIQWMGAFGSSPDRACCAGTVIGHFRDYLVWQSNAFVHYSVRELDGFIL